MQLPKLSGRECYGYGVSMTLEELKALMLVYHYPHLRKECLNDSVLWKNEYGREMFVTPIKDCYGAISTVVFSINGSPPKGVAVLLQESYNRSGVWRGLLTLFGNGRTSRSHYVSIELPEIFVWRKPGVVSNG